MKMLVPESQARGCTQRALILSHSRSETAEGPRPRAVVKEAVEGKASAARSRAKDFH